MSKIHRPPRGLQHLLGSQSFGKNPDQLAQLVTPTIDLTDYYSAELLKSKSVVGALAAEGGLAEIEFQATVKLVAVGLEFSTVLTSNQNYGVDFRLDGLAGTNEQTVIYSDYRTWATGSYPTFGMLFPHPLVVPGGAQIKCNFTHNPGTLITATLRVVYVDLNPVDD